MVVLVAETVWGVSITKYLHLYTKYICTCHELAARHAAGAVVVVVVAEPGEQPGQGRDRRGVVAVARLETWIMDQSVTSAQLPTSQAHPPWSQHTPSPPSQPSSLAQTHQALKWCSG